MQKISPSWVFDHQAEAAANFYVSVFPDSRIVHVAYHGDNEPGPAGSVSMVTFELYGQRYMAANGGPTFKFGDGISIYIRCDTQAEIDALWENLSQGGEKQMCGWVVDQYGVSWQIAPTIVEQMLNDPDQERSARVMKAIYQMEKMDIETLQNVYDGK